HLDVCLGAAAVAAVMCREPGSFESQVHGSICSIAEPGRGECPPPWFAGGATACEPRRARGRRRACERGGTGQCPAGRARTRTIWGVSTTSAAKKSAYDARNLQV